MLVFRGRCFEGEAVPYNAFDGAMDDVARYLSRLADDKAERLLPVDVADLCRMFPVFREVRSCQRLLQRAARGGSEQESRQRAVAALRELLSRIVHLNRRWLSFSSTTCSACDQDTRDCFWN